MGQPTHLRSVALWIAVAVATIGTLIGAIVFAGSDQTARIAGDAEDLGRLHGARTGIEAARADLVIALTADSTGSDDIRDVALANAAERMMIARDALRSDPSWAAVDAAAREVVWIAETLADDGAEATDDMGTELITELAGLADGLAEQASLLQGAIRAEAADAGDTARAASFVVSLIAPALLVFGLHRVNQGRLARLQLTADLDRERAITAVQNDLISGLSHELRTPLTGITGFAEALLDSEPDAEFVDEAGRIIFSEANDLRRMVEDMLVASRVSQGSLAFASKPVPVEPEIEALVDPYRRSGTTIELDVEPATIVVDRLRLRHVLRNLLSNAIKHGAAPIRIVGVVDDDRYVLAVEDGGPGLGEVDLDVIRSGFVHRGDDATVEGSVGLGFSVAHAIAEGMGSAIEHERVDDTTRMSVVVPLEGASVTVAEHEPAAAS